MVMVGEDKNTRKKKQNKTKHHSFIAVAILLLSVKL